MPLVKAADLPAHAQVAEKAPLCPPAAAEEDCQDWGPPADGDWSESEHDLQTGNVKPLSCIQHLQLAGLIIVSLPAIIGSWCWPSLVGLLAGVASSASYNNKTDSVKTFFHGFQVAIMAVVMTNMTQWIHSRAKVTKASQPTHWLRYRPTYILSLATLMIMFQPLSILVIGSWQIGDPYNFYWTDDTKQTAFPNKTSGWLIQIFCTYGGFIVMFFGINDATGLIAKFKKRWKSTREGMRAANENAAA